MNGNPSRSRAITLVHETVIVLLTGRNRGRFLDAEKTKRKEQKENTFSRFILTRQGSPPETANKSYDRVSLSLDKARDGAAQRVKGKTLSSLTLAAVR